MCHETQLVEYFRQKGWSPSQPLVGAARTSHINCGECEGRKKEIKKWVRGKKNKWTEEHHLRCPCPPLLMPSAFSYSPHFHGMQLHRPLDFSFILAFCSIGYGARYLMGLRAELGQTSASPPKFKTGLWQPKPKPTRPIFKPPVFLLLKL